MCLTIFRFKITLSYTEFRNFHAPNFNFASSQAPPHLLPPDFPSALRNAHAPRPMGPPQSSYLRRATIRRRPPHPPIGFPPLPNLLRLHSPHHLFHRTQRAPTPRQSSHKKILAQIPIRSPRRRPQTHHPDHLQTKNRNHPRRQLPNLLRLRQPQTHPRKHAHAHAHRNQRRKNLPLRTLRKHVGHARSLLRPRPASSRRLELSRRIRRPIARQHQHLHPASPLQQRLRHLLEQRLPQPLQQPLRPRLLPQLRSLRLSRLLLLLRPRLRSPHRRLSRTHRRRPALRQMGLWLLAMQKSLRLPTRTPDHRAKISRPKNS